MAALGTGLGLIVAAGEESGSDAEDMATGGIIVTTVGIALAKAYGAARSFHYAALYNADLRRRLGLQPVLSSRPPAPRPPGAALAIRW